MGEAKLNAAYAWGGPDLATRTVSDLLGLPVAHYVKVNLAGFRRLVDLIGGVPMYIEAPMRYVDPDDNLVIDLQPGHQVLDGDRAEQYVRFRSDAAGDDLSRIRRQQRSCGPQPGGPCSPRTCRACLRSCAPPASTWRPTCPSPNSSAWPRWPSTYQTGALVMETLPGYAAYVGPISYFLPDTEGIAAAAGILAGAADYGQAGRRAIK